MSKSLATVALIGVILVNLVVVGAMSALAVNGDGALGVMLWLLGQGALWVGGFSACAGALSGKGDFIGSVTLAAKAMPCAFVIGLPAMYLLMFIRMVVA